MMLKASGIDPAAIMGQAQQLGTAFGQLVAGVAQLGAQLDGLKANQLAIMAHLGMAVPDPSPDQLAIIAAETRKVIGADVTGPQPNGAGA